MHFPRLCGLHAFGFKAPKPPVKASAPNASVGKPPRPFPEERKLTRQPVNLRTLQTLIRQVVEEVEGAESVKRALKG